MTRAAVPDRARSRAREERAAALRKAPGGSRLKAAQFWIQALTALSRHVPGLMKAIRPIGVWFAWKCSGTLRDATRANAARILGAGATEGQVTALAKGVVSSFYEFLLDFGRHRNRNAEELCAEIDSVDGEQGYHEARQRGKGAILVTAHIGCFEVGAAAVKQYEPSVHVVFQRDPMRVFETLRADQRRRLGLIEAAVDPMRGDDAWNVWMRVRDALRADAVVLMQGDRVMPGQRGKKVPFMGGHVMLPPGPVKLALATGAPIIPVCAPRRRDGRIDIVMEKPIWVDERDENGTDEAVLQLARVLEDWVRKYPEQWLMIRRMWCEDLDAQRTNEN